MTISKNKIILEIKEYLLMIIGICLYVLGWVIFLTPNNLIGGGVTGMSSIIQYATGIKMGYTYFTINAILLIIAFFVLGKGFGTKTIVAIILSSLLMNIGQDIVPKEIIQSLSIDNGKLLSSIMGGIIVGTGMGMALSRGGSTGGTDIIALIVNKYRNISPGRMIFMMDVVIILSSLIIPSYVTDASGEMVILPFTEKITTVIFGFILIGVVTTTLDYYLSGSRQSVQIFIYTRNHEKVADAIIQELHKGVTVLDGVGWYSKEHTKVVTVVVRKTDLKTILKYVKMLDPDSFVSVTSATAVYGKGFEVFKIGKKK